MADAGRRAPFARTLYFRVLVGIVAGVAVGLLFPHTGEQLKPIGDGFVKLIKMMIAPVIFFSVVLGIAKTGATSRLGRVGLKALLYFEVVTTFALFLGLLVANVFQPGAGLNIDPATLDTRAIAQYTAEGKHLNAIDFLANIIPDTFVGAFSKGEILQVLLLAILCGVALASVDRDGRLVELAESLSHLFFKTIAIIMEAAPIGAFGAMAFTVGKFGVATLFSLGKLLLAVYATSLLFVVLVLGAIALWCGFSIFSFLRYLREELLLVLGTSSSESALPRMITKMERFGCSRPIVGLMIPAGYSFNLDGTCIYLTIAALFVAQATRTHLTLAQQLFVLLILMLNSKGAAAVTGGGFITLAATLSSLSTIPVAGIVLLLGVDRFMSEIRALTNLVGNGIATVVIARWEGEFDLDAARSALRGELWTDQGFEAAPEQRA